jgi:hypothetical protein
MKESDIQQQPLQWIHRQSYIEMLRNNIIEKAEDEKLPFYTAAPRVLLSWLEYQPDSKDITFIDNKDSGIDAWYLIDEGIELFQVKTHDLSPEGLLCLDPFDNTGVNDLIRAKNLLCFHESNDAVSQDIKEFLSRWAYMLQHRKAQEIESPALVNLILIVLGNNLTSQAQEEFNRFQKSNEEPVFINAVPVQFDAILYTIDSIIERQWQEENREWKDILGNKKTSIRLSPLKEGGWISDNKNAIFYCSASDLVKAYEALGYQLFEPNVRAEIKRSRVNEAIRASVKQNRGRKDFRFLNNGVTITCQSYESPKEKGGRKEFIVHYPGVVNGLQTVVALHNASKELSERDREDFEQNCSVLVRLLTPHAVDDITDVVRATNNQNTMRPRNLFSNSPEQIGFARIFAESLGWFYEAKEGAWNAFEKDPKRWRPSLNKTAKEFKYKNKLRKVDNLELAQRWLSFIGCSYTAANERDQLFENHYDLIFKKRTNKHGFEFEYAPGLAASEKNSEEGAPNASLMLVSYLSFIFVQSIVPSPKDNRKETCERLGTEINKLLGVDNIKELNTLELDGKLFEVDGIFALNHVLRYMPFLFTDFVGFVLYSALDKNIHTYGQNILSNHSFDLMRRELDIEAIKQKIQTETFEKDDLLVILWLMFLDKIEGWMDSDWKQSYRNADRKIRFVLSKETRNRLYKEVIELDKFMQKRFVPKSWTVGVERNQGLFEFIKKCVFEKNPKPPTEPKLFK